MVLGGLSAKNLAYIALSAALIAAGAFIRIPLGADMYITLQVFFVVLSGFLIGKSSAAAAFVYMLLGLSGIPVFAGGGGFGYVLKPTFGYILAFIPAGFLIGLILKKGANTFKRCIFAGLIGVAVIYTAGILYFIAISKLYMGTSIGLKYIAVTLFLSTIWKDAAAVIAAAVIAARVRGHIFGNQSPD